MVVARVRKVHRDSRATYNKSRNSPRSAMDLLEILHDDIMYNIKPYKCRYSGCFKGFARKSDLVRHTRIHTQERPFACTFPGCSKRFIQRSALTVHTNVHTGERPYSCEVCTKAFGDTSSLARHRRIHTGRRPYKCTAPGCEKAFCRKTTLVKHTRRAHENEFFQQPRPMHIAPAPEMQFKVPPMLHTAPIVPAGVQMTAPPVPPPPLSAPMAGPMMYDGIRWIPGAPVAPLLQNIPAFTPPETPMSAGPPSTAPMHSVPMPGCKPLFAAHHPLPLPAVKWDSSPATPHMPVTPTSAQFRAGLPLLACGDDVKPFSSPVVVPRSEHGTRLL